MDETFICYACGEEHPIEERTVFDDLELCQDCLSSRTRLCICCGERIWNDDDCGDENITLCSDCEENHYDHCRRCGRLTHVDDLHYLDEDDDEGYCDECFNRVEHEPGVRNYYYKPDPIFYGRGNRYLGVELEIDSGGESDDNANQLMEIGNRLHEHIYIKHDGSLDDGMEIVTHPMTLEYHVKEMPWREILREAVSMGYVSHQSGTCGLHVHVNRSSLGNIEMEQEDAIARILFLVENFWHELLRFSRRTQKQLERWAARYGRKDDPKDVLISAKSNRDRYTCVNLTPSETIEFRIFRGTLKYNTLIATLQLVERLCDVAVSLSDEEVKAVTWSEFVSSLSEKETPELIQYLKERRLYVNEPVAVSEEV